MIEEKLNCPDCGGSIGCLNGCTGDMTVQLKSALREARKAGRESMREEAAQVQDYLDGLTADHASMTKRIAELEVALHDALACHDCREYRALLKERGRL